MRCRDVSGSLVLAAMVLAAGAAFALKPYLLGLGDVSTHEGRLSFRQPDGTRTVLDLDTGAVLSRGVSPPGAGTRVAEVTCSARSGPEACETALGPVAIGVGRDAAEFVLERIAAGGSSWRLHSRAPVHARTLRKAGSTLLVEASHPLLGGASLQAVDLETGRARWLYAYPTWWSDGVRWSYASTRVDEARAALIQLRSHVPGGLGLVPFDVADAAESAYDGRVEFDPDPGAARVVRRRVALAWAGLTALGVVALALGLAMPPSPWKARTTALLSAVAGLALANALTLDPVVTGVAVGAWLSITGWAWRCATRGFRWLLACLLLAAGAHLGMLFVLPRIVR